MQSNFDFSSNSSWKLFNIINIENLDLGISEQYLFQKFKQAGKILQLTIMKDKSTQMSKGKAIITYSNQDSAEQAIKKFNDSIIIQNVIRVKPYLIHPTNWKANILIENLPEDVDALELKNEFSKFGFVLSVDINMNQTEQQLKSNLHLANGQASVQFQNESDADDLIQRIQKQPITFKGNILKLRKSKSELEGKEESSIFLRAFAAPLPQNLINQNTTVEFIEYGWTLVIKDYLTRVQGDEVEECIVKIENSTRQPWAMIKFKTQDQAQRNLDICEKFRKHPCFTSNAMNAFELIKKHGPPANSDNSLQFNIQEIETFFEQMYKNPFDIFKGESDQFFFIMANRKQSDPDERLITFENILQKATKKQISEFFQQFGKVINLRFEKVFNTQFYGQSCSVYYQTLEDSKRALSEIQDDSNEKITQQKKKIFNNGQAVIGTNLPKTTGEVNNIKKQNENYSAIPSIIKPNENIENYEQLLPTFLEEFMDYSIVKRRMEDFLKIPVDAQRFVLGNLLLIRILIIVQGKEKSISLMKKLIDPQKYEIADIFKLFENFNELKSRIDEEIQLVDHEQKCD
ncbi:unnamed protein product [Paramecium octaurelia]|uniref:Polyadenylate-binding protein n=1 Tax=Paramecium octaurelia TaxID=43137 RepID=A0A8S1WKV3_PAROT|nr:unnamed protein product [Paramecium octaurelia]